MSDTRILDQLTASSSDLDRWILLKGGTVLSMDPAIGDFTVGDVLIHGETIDSVGPDLSAAAESAGVIVVDASGRIVIPGFHDTHRHCWQNQMRRLISDCDDNGAYLDVMHRWLGPLYRPEDVYIGNFISGLGALDAGITSMLDFFHNARTPEYSDAAVEGLRATGIRGIHTSCGPLSGEWDHSWPGDLERLMGDYFPTTDQLMTVRVGVLGASFVREDIALTPEKVAIARGLGVGLTSDGIAAQAASDRVITLGREGLLGPDITLIHCLDIAEEAWQHIADSGVRVSIPTTSDAQLGIYGGVPMIQEALDHGIRPGLSVDVEVSLSSDMFSQMKTLFNIQRMNALNKRYRGEEYPAVLDCHDILELATIRGAETNGLDDVSGSLTPGKQADVVLITANDWNTLPLNHAYGTVVVAADTRNVEMVFVAGQLRKWDCRLLGHDIESVRAKVEASRDFVLDTAGFELDVLKQSVGFSSARTA